jgi:hypothetical protein
VASGSGPSANACTPPAATSCFYASGCSYGGPVGGAASIVTVVVGLGLVAMRRRRREGGN